MKLFSFLFTQSKGLIIMSACLGIVSGLASSALIALINKSLESIGSPTDFLAMLFLGIVFVALIADLSSHLALTRLTTRAVRDIRLTLSARILKSPLKDIEDRGHAKLMAALTEDVGNVSSALIEIPKQAVNSTVAFACLTYLFWLNWQLALVFFGIFIIGTYVYTKIAGLARPYQKKGRAKYDRLVAIYNGIIYGNKELKLNRRRRYSLENEDLRPTAYELTDLSWSWNKVFAFSESFGSSIYFLLIGMVLFIAPQFYAFETSVLTGFTLMALYMSAPIGSIIGSVPTFQQADVSFSRIIELGFELDRADLIDVKEPRDNKLEYFPSFESLEIKDLTYQYQSDDKKLKGFKVGPFDLNIKAGELVFIIGGNGSGKSSLVKLITGLYVPDSGEMLFNGNVISDANRDDYRQCLSVVFSDYYLFKTLYGVLSSDLEKSASRYLERLELSDKVSIENGQLSTVDLSQGQRKRLALLTSFLEDRDVYIFDEWAADQDPVFKQVFYDEILNELIELGKTVLVISHDNRFFERADRIVEFQEGKIIRNELLKK
jgi:putative ATP-binding cassette transporter